MLESETNTNLCIWFSYLLFPYTRKETLMYKIGVPSLLTKEYKRKGRFIGSRSSIIILDERFVPFRIVCLVVGIRDTSEDEG